MVVNTTSAD
jgi:MFS family permease